MTQQKQRRYGLSKSKIAAFEQCPRRLWMQRHTPERAETDDEAEQRFAEGNSVGELACAQHPKGIMIDTGADHGAAVALTQELIASGHKGAIFEAAFEHDGVLVRVDILEHAGRRRWRAYEVKSAGKVKPQYHGDLATQVWVMREAGIKLAGASIRHVDTSFVLQREGDYAGMFADSELLDELEDIVADRRAVVKQARKVLAGREPNVGPGDHCSSPYPCEFSGWCSRDLPDGPDWPVTILPKGAGKKWLEQGVEDLLALDEKNLNEQQARIVAATRSGHAYHNARGARAAMAEWGWPRVWLDFETINFAVPRWVGTQPYEQVPFQFSAHVQARNGRIAHHEFLDMTGGDPRGACARKLVECIPPGATIIAYHAPFERRVLNALAKACPKQAKALKAMATNTVDLLPVARDHWYHRDQCGSWSIKAVLPSMGFDGYTELDVKDGGEAQAAYLEAIDPATSTARRRHLEGGLKAYCMRDTSAMIDVARTLAGKGDPA